MIRVTTLITVLKWLSSAMTKDAKKSLVMDFVLSVCAKDTRVRTAEPPSSVVAVSNLVTTPYFVRNNLQELQGHQQEYIQGPLQDFLQGRRQEYQLGLLQVCGLLLHILRARHFMQKPMEFKCSPGRLKKEAKLYIQHHQQ